MPNYVAKLFPLPIPPLDEAAIFGRNQGQFVGVCVSGGGSRSLSAAMGQFRAGD